MMIFNKAVISLFFLIWTSFNYTSKSTLPYDLKQPKLITVLPDTLREISGMTYIDSNTIACIQDENGILFFYDLQSNQLKGQQRFYIDGDYEGIAKYNDTLYVLRSDGCIFEVVVIQNGMVHVKEHKSNIPLNNYEGLCYDHLKHRLLIAGKGKAGKGTELKDKRWVYEFDLISKRLNEKPVFEFDVQVINQKMNQTNAVQTRKVPNAKYKSKESNYIKLRISAICIHPISNKLFILSAADHMLFVYDLNGEMEHAERLDPVVFNKAEGLTFLSNGNMLISNEAQDKKPTLLQFEYQSIEEVMK